MKDHVCDELCPKLKWGQARYVNMMICESKWWLSMIQLWFKWRGLATRILRFIWGMPDKLQAVLLAAQWCYKAHKVGALLWWKGAFFSANCVSDWLLLKSAPITLEAFSCGNIHVSCSEHNLLRCRNVSSSCTFICWLSNTALRIF